MNSRCYRIIVVAGARPNFVKVAPLLREFRKYQKITEVCLVHTGQHYDFKMSKIFFEDLKIPKPDVYMNTGPGSHAEQTAKIMLAFEKVVKAQRPDLVIVVGDVNSTMSCALTAAKMGIRVAHVEAGLRSFDETMPEEINRIVTDRISDYLFVSEVSGVRNLRREGVDPAAIFFSGNVMIDSLLFGIGAIKKSKILERLDLRRRRYGVVTLHRPSNVDTRHSLENILEVFREISKKTVLIYPIHPRSRKMIENYRLLGNFQAIKNLKLVDPIGYTDFMKLVSQASFVLTDSGGIQEETTLLKVPCLTMRENTERPVTLREGSNVLVGLDKRKILRNVDRALKRKWRTIKIPKFWDGKSSQRICQVLISKIRNEQ